MLFNFSKEMYSKTALLKAAYSFTDDYYVHISTDEQNYCVELSAKSENNNINYDEFKNRILAQTVHEIIDQQTGDIRKLIMARAFASSVIDGEISEDPCTDNNYELDGILKDWFETHE